MDIDARQQHLFETMFAHRALTGASDHPGQFRHDPTMALLHQAHAARRSQDGGMDYMHIPF